MKEFVVILAPDSAARRIADLVRRANPSARIEAAQTESALRTLEPRLNENSLLVSFGAGVIVPPEFLKKLNGAAVNFHAASPEYPGRDPHHFAAYDRVWKYGATAHMMEEKVDAGPILAVEWFDVPPHETAAGLLAGANSAAVRLIEGLVPRLVREEKIATIDVAWGPRKTSRRDFLRLCRVPPYIDADELERRRAAVEFEGRANLHVDLHGWRFRLDGPTSAAEKAHAETAWSEFTEDGYARILDLAIGRYRFDAFAASRDGRHVLWRHDIDFSVHRAVRLAEIECEKGVTATYFFMLHSAFYDLAQPAVLSRARRIVALGHKAGLHFQADAYPDESWTASALERRISEQRDFLAALLGTRPEAVSFHDPEASGLLSFDLPKLAGLVNAYGKPLRERYAYCSDSNGYWRFEPLADVMASERHERLHVLTHPAWWTPEAMPPRARVERCVLGRAAATMRDYDALLVRHGRRNIA